MLVTVFWLCRKKKVIAACNLLVFGIMITWFVVTLEMLITFPTQINSKPLPSDLPEEEPVIVPCSVLSEQELESARVLPPEKRKVEPATIVYSLAVHHKFNHFRDWMQVMWEPQHFYIIHVDSKAKQSFFNDVKKYIQDYPNIELSEERYDVVYYGWSVLWTHIHNFKRAIQLNQTRDYFVNMAGADMPIKTPREINYFLGEHMGRSFLYEHCSWPSYRQVWRNYTFAEIQSKLVAVSNAARREPPSLELRWGQHYVILHRSMVEWIFSDVKIMHLLGWLQNTKSPDEMFYATAFYNSPWNGTDRLFTQNNFKYASWDKCCSGSKLTAGHPCVMGTCDLEKLESTNHLWATKFDSLVDSNVAYTLKKILQERTAKESKTQKVRRIPLTPDMEDLDPEYIDIS